MPMILERQESVYVDIAAAKQEPGPVCSQVFRGS